ncbi:hypothetical protein AB1L88_25860 [Tautonia sp. JC769]|uniref:hypothetical protein n=1 Tax=Tautonia sp. JC769 TaxID=3232135 RepID=UPI00345A4297
MSRQSYAPSCPQCGSDQVKGNKINTHSLEHGVVHSARHNPGVAVVGAGVWVATKIADKFRENWKCNKCGSKFS